MNFRQLFSISNWWGKVLGAFFGYLIAGPVGAFLGVLVGNFFDRGLAEHYANPYWNYHSQNRQSIQKFFFEATFTIMGYIAKADGRVSEEEIKMATLMMSDLRLNAEEKKLVRGFYNDGKSKNIDLSDILNRLQFTCHHNPELLKLFMDIQYKAAQAGGLSELKLDALNQIFQRLGFVPLYQQDRFYQDFSENVSRSKNRSYQSYSRPNAQRHQDSVSQAFAILEVPTTVNKQELKRAYRRLISLNHPDKMIARGLPESMIKVANDKTQKITKAYEQICSFKGW